MSWCVRRKVTSLSLILVILSFCILLNWQSNNMYHRTSSCDYGSGPKENQDDGSWFSNRFNASFHPIMSSKSSVLSKKASKWWKGLQTSYGQPNYGKVVKELFQLIPDQEYYRDKSPNRCRVCSVVGNSGNLKNSRFGPLIDASDFVLRVNKGPTKGFEQDVGSKTTHRVIYPESAVDVDNSTHLVLVAFKPLDLEWLISVFTTHHVRHTYTRVKSTIMANTSLVMVVNPSFMQYVHEVWLKGNGHQPSTGFMTVVLALHICDQVSLFGFGANKAGIWDHYFEIIPTSFKTDVHAGRFEYDMIKELDKRDKIEMYKGWPTVGPSRRAGSEPPARAVSPPAGAAVPAPPRPTLQVFPAARALVPALAAAPFLTGPWRELRRQQARSALFSRAEVSRRFVCRAEPGFDDGAPPPLPSSPNLGASLGSPDKGWRELERPPPRGQVACPHEDSRGRGSSPTQSGIGGFHVHF
ncbi:CMP-N-acetylneuraminate-beta-galactosamide-alpha-2,3-sialyltransferase 1-like [Alosa pseudoharengus]|uniref:CMP-N-acetylneuraminate-beta-galactosamide- alpha-2,3-sialyltransferase 1-like n=1 Tax=Alosa pseudoharengus TaxID=34774 RepID=UPI003F88F017